jgi:hypothetical protein
MMNAARNMWGCTLPSPARFPIERPVSRAPVEALAVTAQQDRTLVALADGRSCDSGEDVARQQPQCELVRVLEDGRVISWQVEGHGDGDRRVDCAGDLG